MAVDNSRTPTRAVRRWPRRLFVAGCLICGAIFLAPSIVARTSLRQTALRYASKAAGATIELDDLQLGWLSPVRISGLRVMDPSGAVLLSVGEASTELPLWRLAYQPLHFGEVRIERLDGDLILRPGGSNWEDLLTRESEEQDASEPSTKAWPRGTILVSEGQLSVRREGDTRTWMVQPARIKLEFNPEAETPLTAEYEIQIAEQGQNAGRLQGNLALFDTQAARGRVALSAEELPLGVCGPLLARVGMDASARGSATLRGDYQWADAFASHHANIEQGSLNQLQVAAKDYLGEEQLMLERVSFRGQALFQGGILQLQRTELISDVGRIEGDGQLRLDAVASALANGAAARALGDRDAQVQGVVDLAQLARLLPRTLNVREDSQITAGQLAFQLRGSPNEQGCLWTGNVRAEGLTAVTAGRAVQLAEPITVDLKAQQEAAGWRVDQLVCRASFLNADGQGSLASGTLRADADLRRLHEELAQFVDMTQVQLAGQVQTTLTWRQDAPQRLQATSKTTLDQLQVELPGYEAVGEPRLQTQATLTLALDETTHAPSLVEQASLTIVAAGDRLQADLTQPTPLNGDADWQVRFETQGDIDRWVRRMQPIARFPEWSFAGGISGGGRVNLSSQRVAMQDVNLEFRPLQVRSAGVNVNEPRVQLQTSGAWDFASAAWRGGPTTFVSSTVAARTDNLTASLGDSGVNVQGDISLRGNLQRVNAIFESPQAPRQQQLLGEVEGMLHLAYSSQGVAFRVQQTVKQLQIVQRRAAPQGPQTLPASVNGWKTVWSEPQLELIANGVLAADFQTLQLEHVSATAEGVSVQAAGDLREFSTSLQANLDGQLSYDLSRLVLKLRNVLGDSVQVEGASTRPFRLQGPLLEADPTAPVMLLPAQLAASAGMGWERANLAGVAIGAGQVQADLRQGVILFDPIAFDVSQGRLEMTPSFDLRGETPTLRMQPGRIAEGLTMTPEMAQTWLKYVAPVAAEATAIQGVFGTEIQQFEMPISNLNQATIAGKLTIQDARLGPGPLTQQFLQLAQQVEAMLKGRAVQRETARWVTLPPQEINYALVRGQVQHSGLRLMIDDLEIRTRGAVGLDQSLSMVAEVIPPASWVADRKVLANLPGGAIQIQISGTLQRPQLDRGALQQIGQQVLGGAARGVLEGELDRALKKLFK